MDLATRWTAARQLLGLSYHKVGLQLAPCSAFEEDPEPRPTKAWACSGYFLVLVLMGKSPGL